jgi:predicted CopG family antitoxin
MSTKTIAVDSRVHERLAAVKGEGESFSKAIDRLLDEAGSASTGAEILRGLQVVPNLLAGDAESMLAVVRENRDQELWPANDLR